MSGAGVIASYRWVRCSVCRQEWTTDTTTEPWGEQDHDTLVGCVKALAERLDDVVEGMSGSDE